ncbi:hypothetical protein BDF14DRAFT_1839973, partial [Spinellus fusiger]
MLEREQAPPKAVNIVRPSLLYSKRTSHHAEQSQSSSTVSFSTTSHSSISPRILPTLFTPASFAAGIPMLGHNSPPSWQPQHTSPTPSFLNSIFPHRLLQRARSNSTLSKNTFITADDSSHVDMDTMDDTDDMDSIDGITDDETESESEDEGAYQSQSDYDSDTPPTTHIVAKIKHGTIMNGKGEFLSKGPTAETPAKDDDARFHRKMDDLEIIKNSLLTVNQTLEATVKRQAAYIAELEKQVSSYSQSHNRCEWPLSPVSEISDKERMTGLSSESEEEDMENAMETEMSNHHNTTKRKEEEENEETPTPLMGDKVLVEEHVLNEQSYQRVCSMLQDLIYSAETAIREEYTSPGRVLTDYCDSSEDEETVQVRKLTMQGHQPWSPGEPKSITANRRNPPLSRHISYGQNDTVQQQQQQSLVKNRHLSSPALRPAQKETPKRTPMERSLSRASSPAVMVTSPPFVRSSSPLPHLPSTKRLPLRPASRQSQVPSRPSHVPSRQSHVPQDPMSPQDNPMYQRAERQNSQNGI